MSTREPGAGWRKSYFGVGTLPFWGVHVAAVVGVAALGWSWAGFGLAIALYYARMFFVCAAYHRYFSHRTFKTSRAFQLLLAIGAETSAQQGVLWWAAHHRNHHRDSDGPGDPHSPMQRGFWWSHIGWILSGENNATQYDRVPDLAVYPELRWLSRHDLVPAVALGALLLLVGGAHALVWGLFVSTVLLWHGTFTINSLAHVWGKRRYATTDDSRNNPLLALITMGEGWHNNHHHYQLSCRQGFRWWEIDLAYYVLRGFEKIGLIWDVRVAPDYIVEGRSKHDSPGQAPGQLEPGAAPPSPAPDDADALPLDHAA